MPAIISVAEALPKYKLAQDDVVQFSRELFSKRFKDIERLLAVFQNSQILERRFVKELSWYGRDHSFEEKNDAYIKEAHRLGIEAVQSCLANMEFLGRQVGCEEIDAILYISSTGIATPSMEARLMNELPFSPHTKRIPIWGLGCAGGASGLSRAYEYCLAFPKAKVLVLTVELCSLTFQKDDLSKSNLVGTSLFADGIACALVVGDEVDQTLLKPQHVYPYIQATKSTLMPDSLDVMGWEVKNNGLYVIFSKDIPSIVREWLNPNVTSFLQEQQVDFAAIKQFVAHPGGKKVLEAYVDALQLPHALMETPLTVLRENGNMSSATILYVLKKCMAVAKADEIGLAAALGPGFSSELLLLHWR